MSPDISNEQGAEFWLDMLTHGRFTAIPRWQATPRPEELISADHESLVPAEVAAAVLSLAAELEVCTEAVLFAAHVKVLSVLTGEREAVTGQLPRPDCAEPLPVRLRVTDGQWREMVLAAHRVQQDLVHYRAYPLERLRRGLGHIGPMFEVVLDLTGSAPRLPNGVVLCVSVATAEDGLRLRSASNVLDIDYLGRLAGYYVTALRLCTDDPFANHHRQSLLSDAEMRFHINGLAGPRRDVPDRRFHELFQDRVRRHPDRVAARCGERSWSYQELNRRANQLANALLARGISHEDVVAVVTKRHLDWLAAVLAVFKAGGAYLPVEPHFPADRIAAMLTRSQCRIAVTEPGSAANLDRAIAVTEVAEVLVIEAAYREGHPDTDPEIHVGADQLAYIYFTSGSTGEPKGAMCEQAGMLNHLYAKIDDLKIGEGTVVAQTAPQCFDISMWQLTAALLTGGMTLIIEQDVILDIERYLDTIDAGAVEILQVVPSYLEVVVSHLEERPRRLPRLRCVSTTGEVLKKELVARWFARHPGITLVNAYGLTETSDDTNHEVMNRVPDRDRVPLGPAVNNVRVYLVDDQLNPVPLGAPGEIVFSGVCVGRGYINDEERTKIAFQSDPHRPGERLYRSGDFGRWLPEGKLEFLGRRDAQVKIRGIRIEIDEIENALLRIPDLRDAAVVVTGGAGHEKHLVAFYSAATALPAEQLSSVLGARLPKYMVPSQFHYRNTLPLTGNGKIDKKTLTALADKLSRPARVTEAPRTSTERRLASAWAEVLRIPVDQIGRDDHFFERGGTSLSAVRLLVILNRLVSLKQLNRYPVLAELAELIDSNEEAADADVT